MRFWLGPNHLGNIQIHSIISGPISSTLCLDTCYVFTFLKSDMLYAAIVLKIPKHFEDGVLYGDR